MRAIYLSLILALVPAAAEEVKLSEAASEAKADLQTALKRLASQRSRIAGEKPELSRDMEALASRLRDKRRQAELVRMSQADRAAVLADQRREAAIWKQNVTYMSNLVGDLPGMLKTRATGIEQSAIDAAIPASLPEGTALEVQLQRRGEMLAAALTHIESLLGGRRIEAQVVAADGVESEGQAAIFGPLAVFSGEGRGGQVYDSNDLVPHLHEGSDAEAAAQIVGGTAGRLKLDLTGGSARALADLDSGPLDLIKRGGFWVFPILLMALISAICGVIKFLGISSIRLPADGWVGDILAALRSGERSEAEALLSQTRHPAAEVIGKALDSLDAGADVVEEVVYESMIGVQSRLQKWLPFIAITAATAPLLGLLGTVSGMIRTFNVIQIFGSGDPKPLAGGISEALITTLFGLVVAIPALILHAMLSRRCQGIMQSTEQLGLTLVNGLRRDEVKGRK